MKRKKKVPLDIKNHWDTAVCFFIDKHRTNGKLLYTTAVIKRTDVVAGVHVRRWEFELDDTNPMHNEMRLLIENGTVVLQAVV
ncbi:hypothetical protein [Shewanella xiamenensis]|jgi:hypothetical protein|uniref:Uncharacterized protein n=1 Tax=Shewanella xiamenensis TaxID=332186 RepID=A0ABT6UIR6_9GAMM|nr:hypothetical protein [Shewanella xiamenensis]MDI5834360.1 hypothetical protein [Shewanella xiamenensis]MDI5842282.1 hypothetical protein [Shewanella xiamenensis]MDI5850192.1 hypothetical protein [Shewanella xiamenensis]MDI5854146.1 hypothetical protein [Shewanella xiamenensis]MDI5858102.1 hypothetical protein [Shewanella xiamenensis]